MPQTIGTGHNHKEGLPLAMQGNGRDPHLRLGIVHCNFGVQGKSLINLVGPGASMDCLRKA